MLTTNAHKIKQYFPSFLYKLAAQSYIDRVYPRHLFIETTASCNLSCSYCPREKKDQNIPFELFRQIVDEASRYGSRSFSLHLFGEPLLYPRIFDAIRYIKQRRKGNTVLLTTNGTKINDCVDDFVSSGIDQAYWTWRPEAKFRESTLLKLRRWGKFRVRFIKEITPERAYKEWENWKNVEGREMHNYGGEIQTDRFKSRKEDLALEQTSPTRWACYHLWLAPAVAWNGNILLCCADPHQKEVLGQFPQNSVAEVWQGPRLASVRNAHLRGDYSGICSGCDVWKQYPDIFFKFQKK